jgi:iron complex outermembrane receptor protein
MKLKSYLLAFMCIVSYTLVKAQSDSVSKSKGNLQELIISGIKTSPSMVVSQVTLKRKDLAARYFGADVPSLLNATPSVNSYSDNGTGFGYSYLRIRGMDQSRVNHSINGIPLNDPESQSVYFNNVAKAIFSIKIYLLQAIIQMILNGI